MVGAAVSASSPLSELSRRRGLRCASFVGGGFVGLKQKKIKPIFIQTNNFQMRKRVHL